MELPIQPDLDINALSRCFKNTVNSYKFYWLLSILDHIEYSEDLKITYDEIFMRMLSLVWYPLDYYKLSFGKKDGFIFLANEVSRHLTVDNSPHSPSLLVQLENNLDVKTSDKIKKRVEAGLGRWVTYRFLSPFFEFAVRCKKDYEVNAIIENLSNSDEYSELVPYAIKENHILLSPLWRDYFSKNRMIIRGFINWHLIKFLQKNNPNAIGLSEKLFKPVYRDLKVAKDFWLGYLKKHDSVCVYSELPVNTNKLSIDHFIPWSYIAHDQLWNLAPTLRHINSAKSDCLPNLERYLPGFIRLQYQAVKFHAEQGHAKLLEDYHSVLKLGDLNQVSFEQFERQLAGEIRSHIRIAANQGFSTDFIYQII